MKTGAFQALSTIHESELPPKVCIASFYLVSQSDKV